jgi:hypothetical protein
MRRVFCAKKKEHTQSLCTTLSERRMSQLDSGTAISSSENGTSIESIRTRTTEDVEILIL